MFSFITTIVLVLILGLTACGSNDSIAMQTYCNDSGGQGLGTAACDRYDSKQVGIAESMDILEPGGLPQDNPG
jgi:hypothetical protein